MEAETGNHLAVEQLSALSKTALVTLWARSMEASSDDPILIDPAAIAIANELRPLLATMADPFYQQLAANRLPSLLVLSIALRAKHFDQLARDFLQRFPRSVIVNLGSGLDTRFERLDVDGERVIDSVRLIDIDLPPMIALKNRLVTPHPRHELLAASVLDPRWMDALDRYDDRRFIFLAEGLLMYFTAHEVRSLVTMLANRFPGSELVADGFHGRWMRPPWRNWVTYKMQRQLHFDREAAFQFGLDRADEMEDWQANLHFLDAWSFLDAHEKKLGLLRWLRHFPWLRSIQSTVHYQLG